MTHSLNADSERGELKMQPIATLRTIQVGTPNRYMHRESEASAARPWETSFVRAPSPDRRWLYITHLDGNAQADTKNHGKLNQAVLLYAAAHYPWWQCELGRPEIGPGGFAENFTLDGITEATAHIGDTYAIGDARIQVTGPRYPCYKIARRWGIPGLNGLVAATGRTGWYCRVLEEGWIEPGLPLLLVARPYPDFTIALVNDFGHGRNQDSATAEALAACPLLPDFWQRLVVARPAGRES
ncbi:MAG: MOSC domain-containing protein [Chloroflexota bacterium]|nr:MOSC domain-containing protein [Chloroflexota bacterium]